jgi:hypothetical protein
MRNLMRTLILMLFSSYVGWVEKTQHLYNFIALGCALLNPTYELLLGKE